MANDTETSETSSETSKQTPKTAISSVYHPALNVTNIRTLVPLILDVEKVQYNFWATLFRNTARAYNVLDHIDAKIKRPADVDDELWLRLDAIVLQWLYGTISTDLLYTILDENATALVAWEALRDHFQDNKSTRTVHLENQFGSTQLDSFPSLAAYCQALKSIADQLSSIGHPVSDERLVLQLVVGLNEDYAMIATVIEQSVPLPSFSKARSMLALEETRRNNNKKSVVASSSTSTVLLASSSGYPQSSLHRATQQQQLTDNARRGDRINRGRGRQNRGGRGGNGGRGNKSTQFFGPWNNPWMQPWAYPPCPFPSQPYQNR